MLGMVRPPDGAPARPGKLAKDPTHSPVFGERFKEIAHARGIPCAVGYGGRAYFGDAFVWLAEALLDRAAPPAGPASCAQ